jgi:TPR repeat protein
MKVARALAALALLSWPVAAVAAPLDDAHAAYDRGDFAAAYRLTRPLADQGNVDAETFLGRMYAAGQGVSPSDAEAEKWLRKAADRGNAPAQTALGLMYATGEGVPRNDAEAMKWFGQAAEQGDARAQSELGDIYFFGQGVARDYAEAVKWYRKAAEQGLRNAQLLLASMYEHGEGVPQDDVHALMWYSVAATRFPTIVADNRDTAANPDAAAKAQDRIAPRMTPAQIAEAQRLAREWKPVEQQ